MVMRELCGRRFEAFCAKLIEHLNKESDVSQALAW
jgi:hypothetical protein